MRPGMKVKVCGMRDPGNLEQVCSLKPDYVGYIFYSHSKRFVGNNPDQAMFEIPSGEIGKVGVFVNDSIARVKESFEKYGLHLVQLHGNETPEYCNALKDAGIPVIKVLDPGLLNAGSPIAIRSHGVEAYKDVVQFLLFDTPGKGWGGTGQKFDWKLVLEKNIPEPFLLSGGIGPNDSTAVLQISNSQFMGIDLNSRFELSPGMKDIQLLNEFITEIRKIETHGI